MSTLTSRKALKPSAQRSSLCNRTSLLLLETCPCGLSAVVGGSASGEEATSALIGTGLGLLCCRVGTPRISYGTGLSELQPCEICGGRLLYSMAETYANLSGTLLSDPPLREQ